MGKVAEYLELGPTLGDLEGVLQQKLESSFDFVICFNQTVVLDLQNKTNTQKVKADKDEEMVEASEENLQLNKARKKAFKKKKKQFQRKGMFILSLLDKSDISTL